MLRSVGHRRIAGELLIGEVRVVLDGSGGFYQIDAFTAFSLGEFGAPDGGIQCGGEKDVPGILSFAIVRVVAGCDEVADPQIGFGAVEVGLGEGVGREPTTSTISCL